MAQPKQSTNKGIGATVKQFVVDNFLFGKDPEGFYDDDSFLERGIIDSTGVLELIGFIERTYSIRINDDEMLPENLDSLNRVVKFVNKKMNSGA